MNKQLFRISNLFASFILLAGILNPFINGCSKEGDNKGKVVATINKEPVKLEKFQREIAFRSKQNPSYKITSRTIDEQLDTIIDRRLMIQEAMKMGLVGNEDFVRSIQIYWEQTLIRELIEVKSREWEKRLFVTEQEIRDYYNNMQLRATFKVIMTRDSIEAEKILEKAGKREALKWEVVGPVAYSDVVPGIFKTAFDMSEGEIRLLKDEKGLFIVSMESKETVDLLPIDKLYNQLKNNILEKKKTDALEEWLKEVREKASIEINKKVLDSFLKADDLAMNDGGRNVR